MERQASRSSVSRELVKGDQNANFVVAARYPDSDHPSSRSLRQIGASFESGDYAEEAVRPVKR